jgi:hypothetical protein
MRHEICTQLRTHQRDALSPPAYMAQDTPIIAQTITSHFTPSTQPDGEVGSGISPTFGLLFPSTTDLALLNSIPTQEYQEFGSTAVIKTFAVHCATVKGHARLGWSLLDWYVV